jgi:hypothetical protein
MGADVAEYVPRMIELTPAEAKHLPAAPRAHVVQA